MTQHEIKAALYAPLRFIIYVDKPNNVTVEYDLPSTLFGQFKNEQLTKVALEFDQKLLNLVNNTYNT